MVCILCYSDLWTATEFVQDLKCWVLFLLGEKTRIGNLDKDRIYNISYFRYTTEKISTGLLSTLTSFSIESVVPFRLLMILILFVLVHETNIFILAQKYGVLILGRRNLTLTWTKCKLKFAIFQIASIFYLNIFFFL